MSPLQFQKHLRLQEARRLMLGEDLDAGEAGYKVGYDDRSQSAVSTIDISANRLRGMLSACGR